MGDPRLCLVCYDIAEPKRLVRTHRFLKKMGLPLQYSVFTARLDDTRLRILLEGLSLCIDAREDDVRVYPLPSRLDRVCLGRQIFPAGVMLLDGGVDLILP